MPKKHSDRFRSDEYFRSIALGDVVTTTRNDYRRGKPSTVIDIGQVSLDEYLRLKIETCDKEEFFVSQQDLIYFEDYPLIFL
ncbi:MULTISPECIES: hypothetical protein [unclassified Granulicatella]|uniref:hypothetical protein n=1 Tax=unclassified Granulicatella TaxID=2630493 RepID=UPI00066C0E0A|nr:MULTISPECIES: hypothetical protein [unclassified Granulicatella]